MWTSEGARKEQVETEKRFFFIHPELNKTETLLF